jgi:hypothetical protein
MRRSVLVKVPSFSRLGLAGKITLANEWCALKDALYWDSSELRGRQTMAKTHENFVSSLTTKKLLLIPLLSTDCYPYGNSRGKLMENSGK